MTEKMTMENAMKAAFEELNDMPTQEFIAALEESSRNDGTIAKLLNACEKDIETE